MLNFQFNYSKEMHHKLWQVQQAYFPGKPENRKCVEFRHNLVNFCQKRKC
jgi:hypothetical protein